jgi:hypothetical protein
MRSGKLRLQEKLTPNTVCYAELSQDTEKKDKILEKYLVKSKNLGPYEDKNLAKLRRSCLQ